MRSPRLRAIPCVLERIRIYPANLPSLSSFFSTDTLTKASSPNTLCCEKGTGVSAKCLDRMIRWSYTKTRIQCLQFRVEDCHKTPRRRLKQHAISPGYNRRRAKRKHDIQHEKPGFTIINNNNTHLRAYKLAAKKLPFSDLSSCGVRHRILVEVTM